MGKPAEMSGFSGSGKVAVVTGASSGMGKGLARMFAEEGFNVVCAARSEDKLTELVADIAAAGLPQAYAVKTDVTKVEDCERLITEAEKVGPVHVLMNCAGVMYFTLMKNMKKNQWAQMIDVNCKGIVNCCGEVLPHMRSRNAGHIINISSDAARMLFPALSVYCASKAFVQMFSKGLRAECVGSGVRVTDIQPGDVKTNLIDTGKVKYTFRDFPLDPFAMAGTMIANCVSEDKYFDVINVLLKTQQKWIEKGYQGT